MASSMSHPNPRKGETRDTLHDFSIEYVRTLAEVFGWKVRVAEGSERGPDLVIEDVTDDVVKSVMFVESEVGHDRIPSLSKSSSNLFRSSAMSIESTEVPIILGFLQSLFKSSSNCHNLSNAFHLGS